MAKKPAKKAAPASKKGFEETLWGSANKLRGSVESSEYKHSSKLSALIDTINNIEALARKSANECHMTEEDLVGRVYEYFLGKFAASEGKGGGEFYTPNTNSAF